MSAAVMSLDCFTIPIESMSLLHTAETAAELRLGEANINKFSPDLLSEFFQDGFTVA